MDSYFDQKWQFKVIHAELNDGFVSYTAFHF